MSVLMKVLGMTVAGVLVMVLYIGTNVSGALFGSASPMAFMVYVGLALTASALALIMYLASIGSASE